MFHKPDWRSKTAWLNIGIFLVVSLSDQVNQLACGHAKEWIIGQCLLSIAARWLKRKKGEGV